MAEPTFGVEDYLVFALMLLISAAIGIYYRFTGGKQKTIREYLLADKNMSIVPVAFSLMASFMSAVTLLGVSSENYSYGTQFVMINISYGLATPIAAYGYLPVFYELQATSAYAYLERRFGKATRLCASVAFSFQMILYMGIVLYAPALALSAVTGISLLASILSVGIVCTFYSTIGGMKAVLVTDVFQSVLMFAAVYCVIIKGAIDAEGLDKIWQIAYEGGRIEFFNFSFDPTVRHTVWSLVIGGGFTYLTLYAVNQAQIQRLLCVKSLKKSQQALWLNWPILTALSLSTSFSGLAIYSRYYDCDPYEEKRIASKDQLLPLFVVDTLSNLPGLPGLFVAGIFSGSLSTVSSAVNSLAAVTLEDYIRPILARMGKSEKLSDKNSTFLSKILVLLYGSLCIGMAFVAQNLGGVLQASLTIFGVVGGPLFGTFTLGMFFWISNQVGAISGLAIGMAISLWIGFGGPKPPPPYLPVSTEGCEDPTYRLLRMANATTAAIKDDSEYFYLYRLSYMWYVVIGFFVTLLVGIVVSFIYGKLFLKETQLVEANLFSPFIQRILPREFKEFKGVATIGSLDRDMHKVGARGARVSDVETSTKF
ncbi:putative sodium-dependent multivitamin transporter [Neocloeon triangulifer]|uniref:putative sodium-dependent multivitamin transporter n=1 Tax=Neocloeon triangulifer TaxID=2078957 RepID=UPI00286ED112|nr:putative sodium-dependent multivitamin transporter [Neocloeon triangulifer]XP_059469785.1 putative sodium-dependent multivitamin transporter [Neocloeon triangulifer]